MKKIEEQTTKFNKIKTKLQNNEINKLTSSINNSILDFMNVQKTKNSFISNSLSSVQNNYEIKKNNETKIKEKNRFFTKKYPEQNKNKDIKAKEITQNEKAEKFLKNTIIQTPNIQNLAKTNIIDKKGKEIIPESDGASITLLNMENGDYKRNEINRIFERERKEEVKNSLSNINKEKNEQNNEIPQNDNSTKKKYMSDEEDEEIEIEKNKNGIKTNEIMKNFLILSKKESEIKYPQNFSIFDESKMVKDNENSFDDIEEVFDNNNNKIHENENFDENKNNININPLQRIENQNQNKENDNNIFSDGLKICIPKDGFNFDLKMSLDNNKSKENKYLGRKTKITEKPFRKSSLTSKNEHSANFEQKSKGNIPKNYNKVILDDEDEEEDKAYIDKNQKEKIKNNINSSLFKSPKSKIEQKSNNDETFIKHEGTKITLMLGSETKNNEKNNKLISNENKNNNSDKKPIKSKSTDSTPKKSNDLISQTKTMNIDNKNNMNKNKINLINKNKNGSQKTPRKDINNSDNYELQCLNNINNILIKISERLSEEKIDKNFMKNCLEICDTIKNMINNPSKKKSIYFQFLLIMKNLFLNISENKVSKNYINEINQIFELIEQYFKIIKKDKALYDSSSFTKRKFAFKYAFAKLELKNMDEIFLKGIIPKTNDEKNNESRSDSNSLIKFTRISKRYLKTSKFLLKELKEFREKMNNSQMKNKYKKYESCPADIQMSPHFMSYNRLFYHCYIILSFYNDYNKLNEELNDKNNNQGSKYKIEKEKNKNKSNQIKHKLNGYGQNENIKEKKRDKSEDIKKIQFKK